MGGGQHLVVEERGATNIGIVSIFACEGGGGGIGMVFVEGGDCAEFSENEKCTIIEYITSKLG